MPEGRIIFSYLSRLYDMELEHRVYMFWMRDRYQLPVVKRFVEYMKEQGAVERL